MSNFAKLGLKNDGTMGGGGGSVSIDTTYPPTSTSTLNVPSTSVITSLFNNVVASPAAGASALGTTAASAVVVGNVAQALTLTGSTVSTKILRCEDANYPGIFIKNTTNGTNVQYRIVAPPWGDLIFSNSTLDFFNYYNALNTVRLGGNTTSRTRVFGSFGVSASDSFMPTFPLHVDGDGKINGNLTIGAGNTIFSGLADLAVSTAPTSTSTTQAASANSLTNAYNNLTTSIIPNQILNSANHGTAATAAVTLGAAAQTLNLVGSTVSINGSPYSAGGGGDVSANTVFGTAAASAVTVGNITQALTLTGSTITTKLLTCEGPDYSTGISIRNSTNVGNIGYKIVSPAWGDFIMTVQGAGNPDFFVYSNALNTVRLGGNTTAKTRVFGSFGVSALNTFVPTFPLHIDGDTKINGNLTIGAGNSIFSGLTDLPVNVAPTSTSTTTAATANALTNAYNNLTTSIIPNQILNSANHGTGATAAVTLGAAAQTLNLVGSTVSINGVAYSAGGGGNVSANTAFGTTAASSVVLGNVAQSLFLSGSSLVVPPSFFTDLAVSTAPTSVSTSTAANANSLTNAYNFIVNNRIPASANLGTTATSTVSVGVTTQNTNINAATLLFSSTLAANISSISALGASRVQGLPQEMCIALTSETGAVTVSTTPAAHFRIPRQWRILGVRGNLYTPSTSGSVSIDIRSVASGVTIPTSVAGGTSIFTTPLSIDATRMSSVGSATAAVINTTVNATGLSDDSGLSVFVTAAGVNAAGCKLLIYYTIV